MKRRVLFTVVSAALLLLISGCASLRLSSDKFVLPRACVETCQRLHIAPTKYVLTVNVAKQRAALFEDGWLVRTFPCSTSRYGIGEEKNSYRTPRGLHRIAEKIGDGESAGTIFRNRQVVGHVAQLGVKAGGITTRILWLEGLEPGFNQGGNVDTHDREVYIHGTGNQATIGKPHSIGCIELGDADLIPLYDRLVSGTLVWIAER